jgi:predicted transcriptional regulator
MENEQNNTNAVELATELTVAWLSNPNTRANATEIPEFLRSMHNAVNGLTGSSGGSDQVTTEVEHVPAVSVRKSLASRDSITSLIDGKQYKTLKRHLANHGLTPNDYRQRYGLKSDYPMVAPAYADTRRELAKKIGLGRKREQPAGEATPEADTKTTKRGRPAKRADNEA